MNPQEVLEQADAQGVHVWIAGDRLRVSPPDASPELIELLRARKPEIMYLLATPATVAEVETACLGSLARTLDEYREAFKAVYDCYVCPKCGEPVLLSEPDEWGKRHYVDWFNGRPHYRVCEGRIREMPNNFKDCEREIWTMLNRRQIIGNLGSDPEMKYTPNGSPVTSFRLATTRTYKDSSGERL